jgi:hypothetical protein
VKINLKHILLFCPWSDPISQIDYSPYLYHLGLITEKDMEHFKAEGEAVVELINKNDFAGAKKVRSTKRTLSE